MSSSFNRVILMGNVTRDLEAHDLASGTKVVDIGLAVNDRVKRGDAWVEEVSFVDVTMFGRSAEIAAEYLSKGSPVLIEGRLKMDSWEKDGQKRTKLKVIGDTLKLLGSRQDGGGVSRETRTAAPARKQSSFAAKATEDFGGTDVGNGEDVPF